jgi:hypothetical protein
MDYTKNVYHAVFRYPRPTPNPAEKRPFSVPRRRSAGPCRGDCDAANGVL